MGPSSYCLVWKYGVKGFRRLLVDFISPCLCVSLSLSVSLHLQLVTVRSQARPGQVKTGGEGVARAVPGIFDLTVSQRRETVRSYCQPPLQSDKSFRKINLVDIKPSLSLKWLLSQEPPK